MAIGSNRHVLADELSIHTITISPVILPSRRVEEKKNTSSAYLLLPDQGVKRDWQAQPVSTIIRKNLEETIIDDHQKNLRHSAHAAQLGTLD